MVKETEGNDFYILCQLQWIKKTQLQFKNSHRRSPVPPIITNYCCMHDSIQYASTLSKLLMKIPKKSSRTPGCGMLMH